MNICLFCSKEFISKKRNAKCCSGNCNSKYWYSLNKESQKQKRNIESKESKISICPICGIEYIKKEAQRKVCSISCSKEKTKRLKKDKIIINSNNKDSEELRIFILTLKAKKYMATITDIFKLIHIHDIYYPNLFYNDNEISKEEIFNKMLIDIIKIYKKIINKNGKEI